VKEMSKELGGIKKILNELLTKYEREKHPETGIFTENITLRKFV